MVTPNASRPAALTQRQVDDLARGQHAGIAQLLHAARVQPQAAATKRAARAAAESSGSSPVALSAQDMKGIARSGEAPARVLQRIASATPAARGKAKAAAAKFVGSAPKVRPGQPAKPGKRTARS